MQGKQFYDFWGHVEFYLRNWIAPGEQLTQVKFWEKDSASCGTHFHTSGKLPGHNAQRYDEEHEKLNWTQADHA